MTKVFVEQYDNLIDYLFYNLLDTCQTGRQLIVSVSVKLQHRFALSSQSKVAAAMSDMFNRWTCHCPINQSKQINSKYFVRERNSVSKFPRLVSVQTINLHKPLLFIT